MPASIKKSLLLEPHQVEPILKRMALQMIERNLEEKEILFAGIANNGLELAGMLLEEVKNMSNISCDLMEIQINKTNPLECSIPDLEKVKNKVVIVVDDVADTGRTMMYALGPLLKFPLKKLEIAVLIDREHKRYPLTSNYIGFQISTTVKEHIYVSIGKKGIEAYME